MMHKRYYSIEEISKMKAEGTMKLNYDLKAYKTLTQQDKTRFIMQFFGKMYGKEYVVYANSDSVVVDGAFTLAILIDYFDNKFLLDFGNTPKLGNLVDLVLSEKYYCELPLDLQEWFRDIMVEIRIMDKEYTWDDLGFECGNGIKYKFGF